MTYPVLVLRDAAGPERLLIGDAGHHLRLDVVAGSVLDGPVRLQYNLADSNTLDAKLMTLRRLLALERLGRFPSSLFPRIHRADRWMMALQAFDERAAGASHRDIAVVLYGANRVNSDWQGRSSYLRCRVQRTLRFGHALVQEGYRRLLR